MQPSTRGVTEQCVGRYLLKICFENFHLLHNFLEKGFLNIIENLCKRPLKLYYYIVKSIGFNKSCRYAEVGLVHINVV